MDAFFEAGPRRIVADDFLNAAPGQAVAVAIDEQRLIAGAGRRKVGTPVGQIIVQGLPRRFPVKGPAFLVPFAPHQNFLPFRVNIAEVHSLDFGQPHPAGVEDFQNGPVAQPGRLSGVRGVQQAGGFILVQERGQGLFHFDGESAGGRHRGGLEPALLHQKVVKGPQGRELADDADAGIAPGTGPVGAPHRGQMRHIAPQKLPFHILQAAPGQPAVGQKSMQVVQVNAPGIIRQAPLPGQMPGVPLQQIGRGRRAFPLRAGGSGRRRVRLLPAAASRQHSLTPLRFRLRQRPPARRVAPRRRPAGRLSTCTRCRIPSPAPPPPSYRRTADRASQRVPC